MICVCRQTFACRSFQFVCVRVCVCVALFRHNSSQHIFPLVLIGRKCVCDAAAAYSPIPMKADPEEGCKWFLWIIRPGTYIIVRRGRDECQTCRAWVGEVKGCQERSPAQDLNKCFMNFKQLAVCPPVVLKDQRFFVKKREKKTVEADKRNLHIFASILQHVNLPPLRSAFPASTSVVRLLPPQRCFGTELFFFFCYFLLLISHL